MKRVLAIARLTCAEGLRMRIVVVFLMVLAFLVLRLPFALKGDATLAGRLQNFLDWSLLMVGFLLSLSTVFLSAATLPNEFRTRSLHLLLTKPVTRFQILLGKWLGVNLLNIVLLGLSGAAIYGFGRFIATRPEGANVLDEARVGSLVWTARQAAAPTEPPALRDGVQRDVDQRIKDGSLPETSRVAELAKLLDQQREQWRSVPPGEGRMYKFENLPPPSGNDVLFQVRYKVRLSPPTVDQIAHIAWQFVDPETGQALTEPFTTEHHQNSVQTLPIPLHGNYSPLRNGRLALVVANLFPWGTETTLKFEEPGSLQVLYRVGTFEGNYCRALVLIWLQLCFLSALGLCFGTFVSFPVGCFCCLAWFLICQLRPFLMDAIGVGAEYLTASTDPYGRFGAYVRPVMAAVLKLLFPDFTALSASSRLIDGLYIEPLQVLQSVAYLIAFSAVLFAAGWLAFRIREPAEITV